MILRRSPSRWPISNRKVWLISLKLNSGDKKKTTTETIIFIKIHFGGRNDGIWPKNDEPLTESYLLTHFQSKICTNLCELEFWRKKKKAEHRNGNFQKNAVSMAETTKFGGKTMNLLWSLGRWPISTWKASQIFANLNSGAKRKRALKWQF